MRQTRALHANRGVGMLSGSDRVDMRVPEVSVLQDYRGLDLKSAIFAEVARDILNSLNFHLTC